MPETQSSFFERIQMSVNLYNLQTTFYAIKTLTTKYRKIASGTEETKKDGCKRNLQYNALTVLAIILRIRNSEKKWTGKGDIHDLPIKILNF